MCTSQHIVWVIVLSVYNTMLFGVAFSQIATSFSIHPRIWLVLVEVPYWSLVVAITITNAVCLDNQPYKITNNSDKDVIQLNIIKFFRSFTRFMFVFISVVWYYFIGVYAFWLLQATDGRVRSDFDRLEFAEYTDEFPGQIPSGPMNAMLYIIVSLFGFTAVFIGNQLHRWYRFRKSTSYAHFDRRDQFDLVKFKLVPLKKPSSEK